MRRKRVLFIGSLAGQGRRRRTSTTEVPDKALPIAKSLGSAIIHAGFDLMLHGSLGLDAAVGEAGVESCATLGIDPKERIRTYPYAFRPDGEGFGTVLQPVETRWQEIRTFTVQEADAVVGLAGGKGTADVLQKAMLSGHPVFPIAVAGGAAQEEWKRLLRQGFSNDVEGDLDFLGDVSMTPDELAERVVA